MLFPPDAAGLAELFSDLRVPPDVAPPLLEWHDMFAGPELVADAGEPILHASESASQFCVSGLDH